MVSTAVRQKPDSGWGDCSRDPKVSASKRRSIQKQYERISARNAWYVGVMFVSGTGGMSPGIAYRTRKCQDGVTGGLPTVPRPYPDDAIATIRATLGLQMKELARALGVERQTVYTWIRKENSPHESNRKRLYAIYGIAKKWGKMSSRVPKDAIHAATENSKSVFDLLCEDRIDADEVLIRLQAAMRTQESSVSRKPSLRDIAAKHGVDVADIPEQTAQFDLLTGKSETFADIDEPHER